MIPGNGVAENADGSLAKRYSLMYFPSPSSVELLRVGFVGRAAGATDGSIEVGEFDGPV